jgi:hypothetical protein
MVLCGISIALGWFALAASSRLTRELQHLIETRAAAEGSDSLVFIFNSEQSTPAGRPTHPLAGPLGTRFAARDPPLKAADLLSGQAVAKVDPRERLEKKRKFGLKRSTG